MATRTRFFLLRARRITKLSRMIFRTPKRAQTHTQTNTATGIVDRCRPSGPFNQFLHPCRVPRIGWPPCQSASRGRERERERERSFNFHFTWPNHRRGAPCGSSVVELGVLEKEVLRKQVFPTIQDSSLINAAMLLPAFRTTFPLCCTRSRTTTDPG